MDSTQHGPAADLEELATVLGSQYYVTSLVIRQGSPPRLVVASRQVPLLSETIYARHGFYWWSWAERIAPAADVHRAASRIAWVLGLPPPPARSQPGPAAPGHQQPAGHALADPAAR
jgi:hypothetical protein